MWKKILGVVSLSVLAAALVSLPADSQEGKKPQHSRGRAPLTEEVKARVKASHAKQFRRHNHRMANLPKATPAKFDCADFGWVVPIKDQGSCGSCYMFSASGTASMAFVKAGKVKNDGSFGLSEQYGLDCQNFGGCNGGLETEVLEFLKNTGFPTEADYGPYSAHEGRCKPFSNKIYRVDDWGYCSTDQGEGVADVQSIKNAMVAHGPISVAAAAGSDWDNVGPNSIISGNSRDVNHAIILTGWDDAKGAWKMRNSWGTSWGDNGYAWIKYGADAIGTDAAWAHVIAIDPVPPGPTPPGPTPPAPGGIGTINVAQDLPAGVYNIVRSGSVVIDGSMSLKDCMEALDRAVNASARSPAPGSSRPSPCDENGRRIDALEQSLKLQSGATLKLLESVERLEKVIQKK